MALDYWLKKAIGLSFAGLFLLVPFFFTSVNYELFEFNKMLLVYAFTAVIAGLWLARMIGRGELVFSRTPFDLPLAVFLFSQLLSALFSLDRHTSFWGYYSRFNGGLLSLICYALLFKALTSNSTGQEVIRLIKLSLVTGALVALWAVLERFGHSFSCLLFTGRFAVDCWVQDVQNRVFASLGQPNWLATYLITLIPLTWAFQLKEKGNRRLVLVYTLLFGLFLMTLLFTGSRSGFLGFGLAFLLFWGLSLAIKRPLPRQVLILNLALTGLVVLTLGSPFTQLNRYLSWEAWQARLTKNPPASTEALIAGPANPTTQLEVGGTESGQIRAIVWQGALEIFRHYPILGSGVETFAYSYYNFRPVEHNLVSEWDYLYNKAHNEYLNYLATTGLLGLSAYLLFSGVFLVWSLKKTREQPLSLALTAGLIAIAGANFFGFSVVLTNLYFFLIPALAWTYRQPPPNEKVAPTARLKFWHLPLLILTLIALNQILRLWRADYYFAQADKLAKQNEYLAAYPYYLQAVEIFPQEPLYQSDLAVAAANLSLLAYSQNDASSASSLKEVALAYAQKAAASSPANLNLLKTRVKTYYTLSLTDDQYGPKAIETLEVGTRLAPTDPKLRYNLGLLYGKSGQAKLAVETVERAVELKPNYAPARNALAIFYQDLGLTEKAIDQLEYIHNQINPQDQTITERIEQLRQNSPD